MKTFRIFDGTKQTVVRAKTTEKAVVGAGYAVNTMLKVEQVCDLCQASAKILKDDICQPCYKELHD